MSDRATMIHAALGVLYVEIDQLERAVTDAKRSALQTSDAEIAAGLREAIPAIEGQIQEKRSEVRRLKRELAQLADKART